MRSGWPPPGRNFLRFPAVTNVALAVLPQGLRNLVIEEVLCRKEHPVHHKVLQLHVPLLIPRGVDVTSHGGQQPAHHHTGETLRKLGQCRNLRSHVILVTARNVLQATDAVFCPDVKGQVRANNLLKCPPDAPAEQPSSERQLVKEASTEPINIRVRLVVNRGHVQVLGRKVLNVSSIRVASHVLLQQIEDEVVEVTVVLAPFETHPETLLSAIGRISATLLEEYKSGLQLVGVRKGQRLVLSLKRVLKTLESQAVLFSAATHVCANGSTAVTPLRDLTANALGEVVRHSRQVIAHVTVDHIGIGS
ncbi:asparagine synthase, putative [Babesia caballi]|uniref:Asparagine synthase, putative n=1 Tax=Babesia caballi TaxID=5871 RepID=A0AAV4LSM1_BABCB|nr:asparagine synthase, putative [Babesia caballi]